MASYNAEYMKRTREAEREHTRLLEENNRLLLKHALYLGQQAKIVELRQRFGLPVLEEQRRAA